MKGIRNVSGTVLLTADGQTTPAVAVDATGKLLVSGAGGAGSAAAVRNDSAATDQAAANGADSKIAVDIKGRAFVNNLDGVGNALASATTTPGASDRGLVVRNIPSGTQTISGSVNVLDGVGNALASATTTPGASDRGLVVRNIPSGTQAVSFSNADGTASGALGALNAAVTLTMAGYSGAGVVIPSGLTGTVVAEVQYDSTGAWVAVPLIAVATGAPSLSQVNPNGTFSIVTAGGVQSVRVRVSAYTSGTTTAVLRATTVATQSPRILGVRNDSGTTYAAANGDAAPIATDPYGGVRVSLSLANVVSGDINTNVVKSLYWGLTSGQAGLSVYAARNDKTQTLRGGSDLGQQPPAVDAYGRQYVTTGVGPQEGTFFVSAVVSTLGNNTLGSAFGAGVRWYITEITWENQDVGGHNHMTLSDGTTVFASATVASLNSVHTVFQQPRRTAANGTFTLNLSNARSSKVTIGGYTLTV